VRTIWTRSVRPPFPWRWVVWLALMGSLLAAGALFGSCGRDPAAISATPTTRPPATASNMRFAHWLRHDTGSVHLAGPGDVPFGVPVGVPR